MLQVVPKVLPLSFFFQVHSIDGLPSRVAQIVKSGSLIGYIVNPIELLKDPLCYTMGLLCAARYMGPSTALHCVEVRRLVLNSLRCGLYGSTARWLNGSMSGVTVDLGSWFALFPFGGCPDDHAD